MITGWDLRSTGLSHLPCQQLCQNKGDCYQSHILCWITSLLDILAAEMGILRLVMRCTQHCFCHILTQNQQWYPLLVSSEKWWCIIVAWDVILEEPDMIIVWCQAVSIREFFVGWRKNWQICLTKQTGAPDYFCAAVTGIYIIIVLRGTKGVG